MTVAAAAAAAAVIHIIIMFTNLYDDIRAIRAYEFKSQNHNQKTVYTFFSFFSIQFLSDEN